MFLIIVILIYIDDCKKIGKENLAVGLGERLLYYFLFIFLPALLGYILNIK